MAIIASYCWDDLPHKIEELDWQKMGLQYTRSGYGRKIPTAYKVLIPGAKRKVWRRVYCCRFSNMGTFYVPAGPEGKDWVCIHT